MVTAEQVKARIATGLSEAEVQPFIDDAAALLASLRTPITSEIVHLYLSCHFVAVRDPRVTQRGTDGATAVFELATAAGKSGLKSTTYGQQAIAMDTTGQLARMSQGKKATLRAM